MKQAYYFLAFVGFSILSISVDAADDGRYHSDSDARYLHHIDLYDANNTKITPQSDRPYSPMNSCGRCHDYETISHGWHFNAFSPDVPAGRHGAPWIWTDERTGTQLPLSYRKWNHTFDPSKLGISAWEMTHKFGDRIPGGGVGAAVESNNHSVVARWPLTGTLEVDCMICHGVSGAYDFNNRRKQIENQNFAFAPTAALRLGAIDGNVSRLPDDSDPADPEIKEDLPRVSYDPRRFAPDGTVFMDLVREPTSNACYQCHSTRIATNSHIEERWVHDEDVHLRAGMVCVDCHRNGIDHQIVRGFDGEQNPSGYNVATLSCAGCHLGEHDDHSIPISSRAGRLGSPQPMHRGLPPIHFEKLSCIACHGGPSPREESLRLLTSLAHGLGEKGHRTGQELPAILGPVYTKGADGRVDPHSAIWPAYWGYVDGNQIRPLAPEKVRQVTRRSLRVRKNFATEILQPKMKSSLLKELLGNERAKVDVDEWTKDEAAKVANRQRELGRQAFDEKVSAALATIEKEFDVERAVYVSSGKVYRRGNEENKLTEFLPENTESIGMITWPIAHNVRPAGWSLGAGGCTECHSTGGLIFASTVTAVGPVDGDQEPTSMAALQGIDADQRLAWNQLFRGRKSFKYIVGGSITLLLGCIMIGIGALAARWSGGKLAALSAMEKAS